MINQKMTAFVCLTLAALIVGAGCNWNNGQDTTIHLLNYHDEPIIIENGSVKIDFNPNKNKDLFVFPTEDGHYVVLGHSNPVKLVKIVADGKSLLCGAHADEPCDGKDIDSRTISVFLDNGYSANIFWGKNPKHVDNSGLMLASNLQKFKNLKGEGVDNSQVFEAEANDGVIPKIEYVSFMFKGNPQKFVATGTKAFKIELCKKLACP